jgi:succinyl-CoA synthetase beta subunit
MISTLIKTKHYQGSNNKNIQTITTVLSPMLLLANNNNRFIQIRNLNIHEHHSYQLLNQHGVRVPEHKVVSSPEEAKIAFESLGKKDLMIKAQVLTGGRGRGKFKNGFKGGVHVVTSPIEAENLAKKMLGQRLITKQTGEEGLPCSKVMLTERLYLRRECYFSIINDRASGGPLMIASPRGGTSIEEVAAETPDQIFKEAIDIIKGPQPEQLSRLAKSLGFEAHAQQQAELAMANLYKLFISTDATLVEINPLAETPEGIVYSCDAKLTFDDNAEFRQQAIFAYRDRSQEDAREVEADQWGLNYVGLNGSIGTMVNGAGLALATCDLLHVHGGRAANFLDLGGGATKDVVAKGFSILNSDPNVKAIFVNIFGGIMKCDYVAGGIVAAAKRVGLSKPLVIRMQGTNVTEAKAIIEASGYRMLMVDDLDEGASKVVRIAQIVVNAERIQVGVSFEIPVI